MSNKKMQTKPYGIEDKKVKIEKIMTRKEKTDNDKKFGIGLYDQPRSNTFSTKTKVIGYCEVNQSEIEVRAGYER